MPWAAASTRPLARRAVVVLILSLVVTTWAWVRATPSPAAGELYTVPASGAWEVEGAGFGHGIGMSQWGAQGAALDGLRPDQILGFYYPGTTFGNIGNPNIRVQLTAYQGSTIVFGPYGNEQLTATDTANGQSQVLPPASRYSMTLDGTWLHLNRWTGTAWEPVALAGQVNIGGPIDINGPSGTWVYSADLSGAGRQYWGTLRLARTSPTAAQSINILPLDAYLKFVVPRESPSWFHVNALQSQAIAARSYARAVSRPSGPFDICDTTQCQVYGGRAVVAPGGAITWLEASSASQAVDGTSGLVMAEGNGAVAFTQFSASNGGYSVAGSKPYLQAKADPYSGKAPNDTASRWTATLQAATLQAHCPSGTLQSFEITGRDGRGPFGGRITGIKVNCTGGSTTLTSGLSLGMKHHMWKPKAAASPNPSPNPNGSTIGNIEVLTGSPAGIRVAGWASAGDGSTARILVVYRTNEYRQINATRERADVGRVHPALGSRHGFDFHAPAPAGATLACVWADASTGRIQLGCATVNPQAGAPFGTVDEVRAVAADGTNPAGLLVSGWAIDPNTGSPIEVHLYWGSGATASTANVQRPDVGRVYPNSGAAHGYSTRVAAPSGSSGELCAYAINVPAPSDNPLLGCRLYTVP